MSAYLSIGLAVALAALKFIAERLGLQMGRNLFVRDGTRKRRTSLLQPSQSMTEAHVRALERVPVEPRLKSSGRLGLWRRARLLNLRPSSPKPVLLLAAPPVVERPEPGSGPWGLDVGGCRLIVRCHPSEDAQHVQHCIRFGSPRTAKSLMVCSISDYFGSREAVETYTVAWHRVHIQESSDDTVIAYGADSLYTAVDRDAHLAQSDESYDVVWLLYDDLVAGTDAGAPVTDTTLSGGCSDCGASPEEGRLIHSEHFPWRVLRITRHLTVIALLGVTVPLTKWWYASIDDPYDLDPGEQLSAIPLVVLWYFVLILSVVHGLNYLIYEARRPRPWTATTTRCYDDGKILRNGYFRGLCRCRRFG